MSIKGNAVIGQSGGPTNVINQSLVGVIETVRKHKHIGKLLGARHGVRGIINDDFIELNDTPQELLERTLVAVRRHQLPIPQRGHLLHHLCAPHREFAIPDEVGEDQLGRRTYRQPRILVGGREPVADLREQRLVVGEDHVLLRPELPEERATGHPGGGRELLDGRRLVAVLAEQTDGLGDDARAKGGRIGVRD